MTMSYHEYEMRRGAFVKSDEAQFIRHHAYQRVGKRACDIILVLLALPAVIPLIAIFAIAVMVDGANPVYFQNRVGRGNKIFRMWKLRSMVPNAKDHLDRLLATDPLARAEWEESQKLKHDPRVTTVGRFIRKFSIDELPQLWNVLRGDMSIVGPRPMMPEQRELYPGQAYYLFRPGITGLWQVSDRNECSFAARSEFDERYAETVSAKADFSIILSTVRVVLEGTGC